MPTKKPTKRDLERQLAIANDALDTALAASPERDNNFFTGGMSDLYQQDRNSWDRRKMFAEALRAWRVNPIARRIVNLTTSFIVGKGLTIKVKDDPATERFLLEWWNHPLNKIGKNAKRWKDEDVRAGNLFFLFSVDESGMSYIRAVPAELIEEIETSPNDVEQETRYLKNAGLDEGWDAYQPEGNQRSFMVHFASNKPVGSVWGEANLWPLLVWIGRYSGWLEDRVRLNRFRTAFMYVVRGQYANEAERVARERQINANPPKPGSVLVTNAAAGEEWGILSANLDAFDASVDGMAVKKHIASGVGFPLHYLAEPESATRTTAEAAGTPTFRTLEEEQYEYFECIRELARIACEIRARVDNSINPKAEIEIDGPDITERDNATLALALGRSYPALSEMLDRGAIDDNEFMRLTYRMIAEVWDPANTGKIMRKPLVEPKHQQPGMHDDQAEPTDPKDDSNAS
jgi:hypothetical protein